MCNLRKQIRPPCAPFLPTDRGTFIKSGVRYGLARRHGGVKSTSSYSCPILPRLDMAEMVFAGDLRQGSISRGRHWKEKFSDPCLEPEERRFPSIILACCGPHGVVQLRGAGWP